MECRHCGHPKSRTIILDEGTHYAKEVCKECGRFLQFNKKPHNLGRRTKTSKYNPEKLGINCCENCRRIKPMLANNQTLEVHHKDHNPDNDIPSNLLVLCTFCHKQVHSYTTYLNDHYIKRAVVSP